MVGADAVVRPERSERPLQKMIGATQILVPVRNPRRPAPKQRKNWKIAGGGYAIHWPDIDEDLSTEGLLRGAPAPKAHARTK